MRSLLVVSTTVFLIATSSHAQNAWEFILGDTRPPTKVAGPSFVHPRTGRTCSPYLSSKQGSDGYRFEYVRVFCSTPNGGPVEVDTRKTY